MRYLVISIMRVIGSIIFLVIALPLFPQGQQLPAESLLDKGIRLQEMSDHVGAITAFNQCIYQHPAQSEAYALRASSKEQIHEFESALTDYTVSLALKPDHYEVLLKRGALLFRLKHYEQAREDFLNLLTLPPGETSTVFYRKSAHSDGTDKIMTAQGFIRPQVFNYLSLIETQLNNCRTGILYSDSAIRLNPAEADYYVNRALARQACKDATFHTDFKHALELNPDHSVALHNLAVVAAQQGEYEQVEKRLTEAIEHDSTLYSSFLERGYYRLQRGSYPEALSDYNQALRLSNTDPAVWLSRGIVKEKLKDFTGAYADFTQAIELKEDFTKAWLNRGNLFNKQGRYREAVEDYTAAVTFHPGYAAAYYNRAVVYHRLKSWTASCEDITRAQLLGFKVDPKMKTLFCRKP